MCFKFLSYGTRGCKKLDCTYSYPKMCKTAITTGRRDRKNCFYYHKTGTIGPSSGKLTSGQSKSTIPLMALNLPLCQNKRHSYPSLNRKVSPPILSPPKPTNIIALLINHRPKLPRGIFPLPHTVSYPSPTQQTQDVPKTFTMVLKWICI